MAKKILFGAEARKAIKAGMDKSADVVLPTMGPRGRNIAIEKSFGGPTITNDGISGAREVVLSDPFENMGAQINKETAGKANDLAGDGTTTCISLVKAITTEGLNYIDTPKIDAPKNYLLSFLSKFFSFFKKKNINVMDVRKGIELATEDAVRMLKGMSKPIKNNQEILQVATISAESEEIGKIIAETVEKVGKDGVITVDESHTIGITSTITDGMEVSKGYISPYMVNNNERSEAELKDTTVLVTDKRISSIREFIPVIDVIGNMGSKNMLIIAEDVEGEALSTFIINKGKFDIVAIKAPSFGENKKETLADIATLVGAKVISEEAGLTFASVTADMLGSAKKVVSSKDSTKIIGGGGFKEEIDARIALLKSQLEAAESNYDKTRLEERIGKLSGGVAVIKVGASTETEMRYLKLKIEDAVNATKAAIAEGIVAGGGVALARVSNDMRAILSTDDFGMTDDERAGYEILMKALTMPLRQIAQNAGRSDLDDLVSDVVRGSRNYGYNAKDDVMVDDMIVAGIVDPVKVTRAALQNASSSSAIFLTTDVAIVEDPDTKQAAPDYGAMGF